MKTHSWAWLAAALLPGGLLLASAQSTTTGAPKVDFVRDVQPILKAHCFQCHGAEQQQAGLRLDKKELALKGGASGKAILPGDGAHSRLLQRILGQGGLPRMPMGFAPLPSQQTATIRAWIDQGVAWPDTIATKKHWAYIKPVRSTPPKVKNAAWVRNPIDNFVLARLEKEGLTPSPEAPKEVLIRRVYLDLIGLPPSVKEIDAFLADKSPNAYEKVVDRLLALPQYGERWARPWLDLARYADTNGYEKDERRSIWPYRDWVINALNRDMPFDQFTIEQIAGDLLPNATNEQKIATGFNRNTMLNEEGGVDKEEQRWLTNVDRVGTTASVWLGSTLQCAQCHNHKYDPFTQKDFYRFLAFYDHCTEPNLELPTPEQAAKRKAFQDQIAELDKIVKNPSADKASVDAAKAKQAELKKQLDGLNIPTTLVFQEKADSETPSTYLRIKGAFLSKGDLLTAGTPEVMNPLPPGKPQNRLGLAYWLIDENNPLTARVAVNRFWEQYFGHGIVETSEDFGTQGAPPTHPELLDWLAVEFMHPGRWVGGSSGRWENRRLTTQSPNDLITQRPTDPKPWSMKRIHRLIVTSAAYRQSSRVTPAMMERDPTNRLLARGPRFRMEAEMIRDMALSAAGLLSLKVGGPSVFPPQPDGIWSIPYSGDQWVTSAGDDKYRRGLYTFWRRTSPYPEFLSFDASSREFCTVRRIRTNTPLQALTTLNDPAFFEAARGLARRMQKEGGTSAADRITIGFRSCVARRPSPTELSRLTALYNKELSRYQADAKAAQSLTGGKADEPNPAETAALTVVANVLLNMDETLNKE